MASDIVAVLDHLGLDQAHYMGYSSGGYRVLPWSGAPCAVLVR